MTKHQANATTDVLNPLTTLLEDLESLYKDIHSHPELSMQETRTAGKAAERLQTAGFDVTTGVGRLVSSGSCATVTDPSSCSVPIWMRCRSRKPPGCHMPAR
jgi:hippurate hydrolase